MLENYGIDFRFNSNLVLFIIVILVLGSCSYQRHARASLHLSLHEGLSAEVVYEKIQQFATKRRFKKYDRMEEVGEGRVSEHERRRHYIDYLKGRLSMVVINYSDKGHVGISVYEYNPGKVSFTEKGVTLFQEVKTYLRSTFPDAELTVVEDAVIAKAN